MVLGDWGLGAFVSRTIGLFKEIERKGATARYALFTTESRQTRT